MTTLARWHDEMQSAWIYRRISACEDDPKRAQMFLALAGKATEQAAILEGDLAQQGVALPEFAPTLRARMVTRVAERIGVRRARPLLAALKVRGLSAYGTAPPAGGHAMPLSTAEIGARHRRAGSGGNLRAAVFGVNDGLVSNVSLIMGMAGADAQQGLVVTSGIAGLLAGAFSMAAGEYISVRSQRELYERQIGEEREELERYPAEEAEELALIYQARGVPLDDARAMTQRMLEDKEQALRTLAREELGLDPDALGSPIGAATASFAAFAAGAALPLLPFVLPRIGSPVAIAAAIAALALFVVGGVLSLFSGRSTLYGGLRMVAIGAAAAASTFGIGRLIGVSVS